MYHGQAQGMPSEPPMDGGFMGQPPGGRLDRPPGPGPEVKPGIFFKTRMCFKWQQGQCLAGSTCTYAHGEHELRQSVPDSMITIRKHDDRDQNRDRERDRERDRSTDRRRPEPGRPLQGDRDQGNRVRKPVCHNFMNKGTCSFGSSCKYSHGMEETNRAGNTGQVMLPGPPTHRAADMDPPRHMMDPYRGPDPMGRMNDPLHMPPPGPSAFSGRPMSQMGPPPIPQPAATIVKPLTPPPLPAHATPAPAAAAQKGAGAEVSFADRVRAVCGLLNIGNAAGFVHSTPAALLYAVQTINNGSAFRENPFADSVEHLIS